MSSTTDWDVSDEVDDSRSEVFRRCEAVDAFFDARDLRGFLLVSQTNGMSGGDDDSFIDRLEFDMTLRSGAVASDKA
jgi:hypothetical protein